MIRSNRKAFIGAHMTASVKKALEEEARKRGLSMSAYLCNLLTVLMRKKGYKV